MNTLRLLYCIFWFGIVVSAAPTRAQDTEPQPFLPSETPSPTYTPVFTPAPTLAVTTSALIFSADAEVIFPAGVRFSTIILRNRDDITAASVTVETSGLRERTFEVDLGSALMNAAERNPEIVHFWAFTPEDFPMLFSEIRYQWTVQTVFNESLSATGVIQFTDSRVLWDRRMDTGRRYNLALPRGLSISQLSRTLDPVYDLMAANTGQRPEINVMLYDRTLDPLGCVQNREAEDRWVARGPFSGEEVPCAVPTLAEQILTAGGYSVLQGRAYDFEDVQDTLSDYFFAQFYDPLWVTADLPAWFSGGLRALYRPTSKAQLIAPALTAARAGTLLTLEDMSTRPTEPHRAALWDAQSFGMVLFMADSIGLDALWQLARRASGPGTFAANYERTMSQPLINLVNNWRDWLFSSRAQTAYGLVVYAPPTATLLASLTFTPFPPTRTPRPEPSATLTPTITLTPTVRPTATLTPTVTPRPPGSLATPTGIAAQPSTPLIVPGSRTSILAVLLIMLAALVILFARVGRR
jgi:hypothetical protein